VFVDTSNATVTGSVIDVTLPDRDPNFDTGSVQGLVNAVESALAIKSGDVHAPALATPDPAH